MWVLSGLNLGKNKIFQYYAFLSVYNIVSHLKKCLVKTLSRQLKLVFKNFLNAIIIRSFRELSFIM